jgi:hypothetical protein
MSAFKGQPQLVLYPLPEVEGFTGFMAAASEAERLRAASRVGQGLGTWHGSGLKAICQRPLDAWLVGRASAVEELHGRVTRSQSAALQRIAECLNDGARTLQPAEPVPAHGGFGWDCVLRDGDTLFFYEFEHTCAAHPGLDVGGFVADLRASGLPGRAEQAFLDGYDAPEWAARDLGFFVAHAALQRLDGCVRGGRLEAIDGWLEVAECAA